MFLPPSSTKLRLWLSVLPSKTLNTHESSLTPGLAFQTHFSKSSVILKMCAEALWLPGAHPPYLWPVGPVQGNGSLGVVPPSTKNLAKRELQSSLRLSWKKCREGGTPQWCVCLLHLLFCFTLLHVFHLFPSQALDIALCTLYCVLVSSAPP
jgi:hypothetical protein